MFNFPTIIVERQKKKSVSNEMKVATYFLHGESTQNTHIPQLSLSRPVKRT